LTCGESGSNGDTSAGSGRFSAELDFDISIGSLMLRNWDACIPWAVLIFLILFDIS
jgi:hypothetical protein